MGNIPPDDAEKLSPSPKPGWEKGGVQGPGAFPVLPETLGLGQPQGHQGWQWLQLALGMPKTLNHPLGMPIKPRAYRRR